MSGMWGRVRLWVASLCFAGMASASAALDLSAVRPHLTFNLASHHAGASQHFNERNSGVGLGFHVPSRNGAWQLGAEVGWYRNSNNEQSEYIIATADRRVLQLADETELSLGVMVGLANYHGGSEGFGKKGIPTIGDWMLAGGAVVSLRHRDRTEFRMGIHPAPEIADFLLTFQIRFNL